MIDEERVQLLLWWRHTGFSVHNSVAGSRERLIRYVMPPPVALERLQYDQAAGVVEIRSRPGSDDEPDGEPRERVAPDELVARGIAPVPDPKRHLIHAYGWYANAAPAKWKRDSPAAIGAADAIPSTLAHDASTAAPEAASELSGSGEAAAQTAERRAARRRWAGLIRRIYQVDPLVCSNCGGPMKIVAFMTDRKVIRAILASMRKSATPAFPSGSPPPPPPARPAGNAGVEKNSRASALSAQEGRCSPGARAPSVASRLGHSGGELGPIQIVG